MQNKSVYIVALSELNDQVKEENSKRGVGRVNSERERGWLRIYAICLHIYYL